VTDILSRHQHIRNSLHSDDCPNADQSIRHPSIADLASDIKERRSAFFALHATGTMPHPDDGGARTSRPSPDSMMPRQRRQTPADESWAMAPAERRTRPRAARRNDIGDQKETRFCLEDMETVAAWLEKMTARLRSYQSDDLYHRHGEIVVPEEVYAALLDGLDKTHEMLRDITADNETGRPVPAANDLRQDAPPRSRGRPWHAIRGGGSRKMDKFIPFPKRARPAAVPE
jgi:hypothetical protein